MNEPPPEDQGERQQRLAVELIEGGSESAGAAAGAALGLLGGPVAVVGGAVLGAALVRVLKHVGADIKDRVLGPREEVRIGAAFAYAGAGVQQGLEAGQQPRDDGFFTSDGEERPPAEEVLEGALLRARDAYQEKKVRHFGMLYAAIAFRPEISPAHANFLIEMLSRLSYRQLVVMALAMDDTAKVRLRQGDYRQDLDALNALGLDGLSLMQEIYAMYQQGLINDAAGSAWISVPDVNPGGMRLQGSASVLAQLAGLAQIPPEDKEPVAALLS